MGRLVKAVKRLDLFDALGVHALLSTVARTARFDASEALGLGHVLFYRSAGDELDDGKSDQEHTQQGGQHEQKALDDVGEHGLILRLAAFPPTR